MNAPNPSKHCLEVIGASAGSGKTYALTQAVLRALNADAEGDANAAAAANAVAPEELVGVTFTIRAADELASRIRRGLHAAGGLEQAHKLPLAYLGTIHSVAFRLLQEYSVDAGLVPGVEVLSDDKNRQLRRVVERTLSEASKEEMVALSRSMAIAWEGMKRVSNWLHKVYEVMDLARSNRIAAEALPAMGRRSADELLALLPPPVADTDLDARLERELERAIEAVAEAIASGDTTKGTTKVLGELKAIQRGLHGGRLGWEAWPKLAAVSPAKKSEACVEALRTAALRYQEHPRFHRDLRQFIEGVFQTAQQALETYEEWKRARGLVDYTDMLALALDLLDEPSIRDDLSDRLRLAVVDEFQDTSPIQLALFVKLHQLAGRSIWVGDRKQCIFEFAGADPRLMQQVLRWAAQQGGTTRQLETNYRSRAELVRFCSHVFSQALSGYGYAPREVTVGAHRTEAPEQQVLPVLGRWQLVAKSQPLATVCVARGVQRLLQDPAATPIVDRQTDEVRELRPGDVAILVRTNAEARTLATQLSLRGVRAAIARPGLLATPEGLLVTAGLAYLLSDRDRAAMATLDALHDWNGIGADAWLQQVIEEHRRSRAQASANAETAAAPPPEAPAAREIDRPWRRGLDALRPELGVLSASEAVIEVMNALDATSLAVRWPDAPQRLANLDALRALATEYEALCRSDGSACTIVGLLQYFSTAAEVMWDGEEMTANDDQSFTEDSGAVVITTYHRAKGLEWPVVILSSLDKDPKNDVFGVHLESDHAEFDPDRPLGGRWIRYWPSLFARRRNGVPLVAAVEQTPYGQRDQQEELEERARLLYVGMTRARDHLIFATRPKTAWLDELSADNAPLIKFFDNAITVGGPEPAIYPTRVWELEPEEETTATARSEECRNFEVLGSEPSHAPPYRVSPSTVLDTWPDVPAPTLDRLQQLGPAVQARPGKGFDWDVFGLAVHGFLACDLPELTDPERRTRAERLLAQLGDPPAISIDDTLALSDRLKAFVEATYPGATWHREVPITSVVMSDGGPRRINGTIDLLLETDTALVLIDHKSFPASHPGELQKRANTYASQLGAYIAALACAHPKPVAECWIHFPVAGVMVGGTLCTQ